MNISNINYALSILSFPTTIISQNLCFYNFILDFIFALKSSHDL